MEIFDSNNSSSSDIMWESWETGVELRNSHVMWIAGDLKSTIGGPGPGGRGTVFLQYFRGREALLKKRVLF